jgi:adhesin transport system outer membrane protein
LTQNIPADAASAIQGAQQHNGALLASIENVRASNAALASRSGVFQPRFDARLRRDRGNNMSGIPGRTDNTVAEVVMNWNLFNGLSDRARGRQFAEQLNVAKDLRDKTCRDIRQTLLIAYNDVRKLKEQMGYLDQNKVSVEKARNAYRQQFDIGQRTLLDLLDTENELFQAKRAAANAEQDLNVAYARTHAGLGTLLAALELSKIETGDVPGLAQWSEGEDAAQHCPAEPVALYVVDKGALAARATDLLKQTALLNARERAVQEVLAPAATPPGIAPMTAPASSPDGADNGELRQALEGWRAAWSKREVDAYLEFYAPGFVPPNGGDRGTWVEKRKAVLGGTADISVEISDLTVTLPDATHAVTAFKQTYRSPNYRDVVIKTLQWVRKGDRWLITRESSAIPVPGRP